MEAYLIVFVQTNKFGGTKIQKSEKKRIFSVCVPPVP